MRATSEGTLFTDQMRKASKSAHKASDALASSRLVVLLTDKHLYGRALACFYFVFRALEAALDPVLKTDPVLCRFASVLRPMYRARRFQADVAYYLGASWELAAESERSPAVRRYEAHLAAIGRDQPLLLLAHAYTQFLAIASGGQIFRRMVRKQLGLPEDEGTAAFEYDTGPGTLSHSALASNLKSALNALADELPSESRQQLIDEHVNVFKYNASVINSFQVGWGPFFSGLIVLLLRFPKVTLVLVGLTLTLILAVYHYVIR